ncbi:MAG: transglutaminase family protein [Parvibaculum sp.]|nr:transglutaminase family protein [Parvibaculum sp.]
MIEFLKPSDYVDSDHPEVVNKAKELSRGSDDPVLVAKACFEFVRDEIKHSWDFQLNPVTCRASDVLKYGTGYCYAKSHLLAALLRANQIPAGLCYQRIAHDAPAFCLHGLNAVFLEPYGWYRIDARGNKPGVNAEFCPPSEKLAFPIFSDGEADLPEIWTEPLPVVVKVLEMYNDYLQVAKNLPDIPVMRISPVQLTPTTQRVQSLKSKRT